MNLEPQRTARLNLFLFLLGGLVIGATATALFAPVLVSHSLSLSQESYHAVFLSNNQVYFGKLSKTNTSFPVLSDVYYIQAFTSEDLASTANTSGQLQLVKLGSELHQPQDTMYLNKEQILFIEPLKPDSKIVQAIANYKSNQR